MSSAKLDASVDMVRASRPEAGVVGVVGDVGRRETAEELVATARDRFGRLDILVNNAGIYPGSPFLEMTEEFWDRTINVNLTGAMLCMQAAAKQMIDQGEGGRIINIISPAALRPTPEHLTAYSVAKAGVKMLTATTAKNLARYQIRVNEVAPGPMESPGMSGVPMNPATASALGRTCDPDEVALGVFFLASGLAAFAVGASIVIDGRRTLL